MPQFDVTKPETTTADDWTPLATGQYVMEIAEAKIAPSPFPDNDGEIRDRLTVVWKLAEWSSEYAAAGYEQGQKVFQQFNPWYGETKKGASKFKQFVDPLINEGLIPKQFYIADGEVASNQGDLIGIKRRVMVEHYLKSMGPNKGQPGNRVLAVTPLKNGRPGQVDLAEVDAADAAVVAKEVEGMTHAETIDYARTLARECGSFWAKRNDWDKLAPKALQNDIKRMQSYLNRATASDPNEDLF